MSAKLSVLTIRTSPSTFRTPYSTPPCPITSPPEPQSVDYSRCPGTKTKIQTSAVVNTTTHVSIHVARIASRRPTYDSRTRIVRNGLVSLRWKSASKGSSE